MTDPTTRPTRSIADPSATAAQDPPSPVAQSAVTPATISVANNLSDDAILATGMLVAPTANSQALFANPFAADREEMLFIDVEGSLLWLTHGADDGWTTTPLMAGEGKTATADEVVVAVHVDGTVWAVASDVRGIRRWRLAQSGDSVVWVGGRETPFKDARGLQVQYLAERPARPIVFFLHDVAGLLALQAQVAMEAPGDQDPWLAYDVLRGLSRVLLPERRTAFYGLDSIKGTARVYTVDEDGTLWMVHGDRNSYATKSIGAADDVAGLWHTVDGTIGCIALRAHNPSGHPDIHTITTIWPVGERVHSIDAYVDARLREAAVWEDGSGRYHLYGLVDGALRVVHQKGLHFYEGQMPVPSWDSVLVTVESREVRVAVSTPLTGSVDMYALDAFPDEYPSQHVMHVPGSAKAAERCVIMTQDVTTTWWSREVVRLRAQHKPYKMKTHESRLTVLSQGGAPVAGCAVTLTADRAVEFRIGGEFYRCGPEHPVTTRTDHAGVIRLATVARDLVGCTIHATAVGLPDGTSFNPVTDLHNFLGGNGTLPMHKAGLSEEGLRDAKTSDERWVFPAWHGASSLAVVPQPAEVLSWCQHAYRAKTLSPSFTLSESGERVPLRGIVLQTWDPSRPAYEEVTSSARQGELAAARAVRADDWDTGSIGDVFLAIGEGLATVVETGVDFLEGTASVVIEWVGGRLLHLELLWDQSENPFQFVQAVFNELESDVEDVLDWLSWVFDWDDVMATADALRDGLTQLPQWLTPQIDYVRDIVVEGWFAQQKDEVHRYFTQVKQLIGDQVIGDKPQPVPSRVPLSGAKNPPPSVVDPQKGLGPKTNWMFDWLTAHADGDFLPQQGKAGEPREFRELTDAIEAMLSVLDSDTIGQDFLRAVDDIGSLVTNLFDASDLQSLARLELVTFLDVIEDLVDFVLDLADGLVKAGLTLIEKVLACIPSLLEMDFLEDSIVGWLWEFVCEEAGIEYTLPTLGEVFITCAAFLLTIVSKGVLGSVPFPDGFPDLLAATSGHAEAGDPSEWVPQGDYQGPEEFPIPPLVQTRVQAMVGVFQLAFTGVDFYMDSKHVAGSNDPPATDGERLFVAGICLFDLIAFGVLDAPVFWGCTDLKSDPSAENWMWWGEYFCKAVIYAGDIGVALLHKPAEGYKTFSAILGTMQGEVGNGFITALGLLELGMSITLGVLGGMSQVNYTMPIVWVLSQTLSMLSSVTAFMRIGGMNAEQRWGKYLVDGIGDVTAGFWYLIMGAVAANQPPEVRTIGWPTEVREGEAFSGTLIAYDELNHTVGTVIAFSPPGWRFDDTSKVPAGLAIQAVPKTKPPSMEIVIAGTLAEGTARDEPYVFDVRCANIYEPTVSSTITLSLTVKPQKI